MVSRFIIETMITEETLQNFINNLHLGKYNTDKYKFFVNPSVDEMTFFICEDDFQVEIVLKVFAECTYCIKQSLFGPKIYEKNPPRVLIKFHGVSQEVKINKTLYDEFILYFQEARYKKYIRDAAILEQMCNL